MNVKHEIKALDGCNAYVRIESGNCYEVQTLVSYCTPVVKAYIERTPNGNELIGVDIADAAVSSATTKRQVARYLKQLRGQVVNWCSPLPDIANSIKTLAMFNCVEILIAKTGYITSCGYVNSTKLTKSYEPRRAFVNGYYEVKPAYPGSWRVW